KILRRAALAQSHRQLQIGQRSATHQTVGFEVAARGCSKPGLEAPPSGGHTSESAIKHCLDGPPGRIRFVIHTHDPTPFADRRTDYGRLVGTIQLRIDTEVDAAQKKLTSGSRKSALDEFYQRCELLCLF